MRTLLLLLAIVSCVVVIAPTASADCTSDCANMPDICVGFGICGPPEEPCEPMCRAGL